MWSRLSHKQKVIYGVIGTLLLLIIGYQLSFQKSIGAYQEYTYLSGLTSKSEGQILAEIRQLTEKKKAIDSLKEHIIVATTSTDIIASLVNKADVFNLSVVRVSEEDTEGGFLTSEFKGPYVNMVKLIRYVESEFKSVKLESVDFHRKLNRRTKEQYLTVSLTLSKYEYEN